MTNISRSVIKWLQSLDLSIQIRNPKRECMNAVLFAEIFSWYFPNEIRLDFFINGSSTETRVKNWELLNKFIEKKELPIPKDYVYGTMHCKTGAAEILLQYLHEMLTGQACSPVESDLFEQISQEYQMSLPMFARSTASQRIKDDISLSEEKVKLSQLYNQQKAQHMIQVHLDTRRWDRETDPDRFKIRPGLISQCPRISPHSRERNTKAPSKSEDYCSSCGDVSSSVLYSNCTSATKDDYCGQCVMCAVNSGDSSEIPQINEIVVNQEPKFLQTCN